MDKVVKIIVILDLFPFLFCVHPCYPYMFPPNFLASVQFVLHHYFLYLHHVSHAVLIFLVRNRAASSSVLFFQGTLVTRKNSCQQLSFPFSFFSFLLSNHVNCGQVLMLTALQHNENKKDNKSDQDTQQTQNNKL